MAATSSYQAAGVDINEAQRAVELIASAAAATATPAVLAGVGGFGGLFRFDPKAHPSPILVASTDPIGTKLKVAIALGRFDTIGVDLVNQNVNDIAVVGADPLFFLDYLAVGHLNADLVAEIVRGIADACAAAGTPLIGGETAELPGIYRDEDFDLSGFIVGVVARRDLIDGRRVRPGDVLLGLPSSGLHTNGYSLARRIFPESEWGTSVPGLDGTIGEALLAPHRSYLDELRTLRRALRSARGDVLACAHITGGGWVGNIPRTLPEGLGVEVETGTWQVPLIFTLMQERGDIADDEMVRVFNLGIGMTVVVRANQVERALEAVPQARRIGRVTAIPDAGPRVVFR
jgi:phosphoribosylformylglycinamidine cyclo-ligase